jgi:hypothetical protein
MTYYTLRLLTLSLTIAACGGGSPATHHSATGDVSAAPAVPADLAAAIAASEELKSAQDAIESGHPWRATEIHTPLVRDPKRRTPAAVLLAARAAAAWSGWSEVDALLSGASWLDSAFGADGRELLACAALEQNHDSTALVQARAAVARAPGSAASGTRQVYLARAYDRMNQPDSAALY